MIHANSMSKCKEKQPQRSRWNRFSGLALNLIVVGFLGLVWQGNALAAGGETPLKISYPFYPPAPKSQTQAEADSCLLYTSDAADE